MFFCTDDITRWGSGLGRLLHDFEVDQNFWDHEVRITALEHHFMVPISIASVTQPTSNTLQVNFTDASHDGPFTLPSLSLSTLFKGDWAPITHYNVDDIFTDGSVLYFAAIDHTSAATFDPNATDGFGHQLYTVFLRPPAIQIATGGAVGSVYTKTGAGDYVASWLFPLLSTLHDVVLYLPTAGQLLGYNGTDWVNVDLPLPGASTPGGVEALAAVAHTFVTGIGTDGIATTAIPAFSDLTGFIDANQFPSGVDVLPDNGTFDVDFTTGALVRLVIPSAACTLNATVPPANPGGIYVFEFSTSGTSSYLMTFGTNFVTSGTLATGTVNGKTFTVTFVCDIGFQLVEIGRTGPM